MNKVKVVLIDYSEDSLVRTSNLLKKNNEIEVVSVFQSSISGLDYVLENKPDLVILDIEMPEVSGIKIAQEINKQLTGTKVIFYSEHAHYAIKAIKAAVFDYWLKPISIDELNNSLRRFRFNHKMDLSDKEIQIIRKLSEGFSSKLIGEKLFISKHTVDKYRRNILEKTNCHNTAELVRFVSQVGVI